MTHKLLHQALDILMMPTYPAQAFDDARKTEELVNEIRAELAKPEQKPHYIMRTCTDCNGAGMCRKWGYDDYTDGYCHSCRGTGKAIYAAGSDEPIHDWDIGERPIELAKPEQTNAVRIVQKVTACRECPNCRYESSGFYRCEKLERQFDTVDKPTTIPEWCPLELEIAKPAPANWRELLGETVKPGSPAWHDGPTVPGLWYSKKADRVWNFHSQATIKNNDGYVGRWYGPIPEDKP